jgi:hypothetical protein
MTKMDDKKRPPLTTEELFALPEMQEFLRHAQEDMFPKLQNSVMTFAIFDENKVDAKIALELGATILFDKPLIVVADKNKLIPARLLRIADAVIDIEDWKNNPEKAREIITRTLLKIRERYPSGRRTPE